MIDTKSLKENHKTSFLASRLEEIDRQVKDLEKMSETDPALAMLSEEERKNLSSEKEALVKQIEDILAKEQDEEEYPNEIILEVRAGAGGEEAALFAKKLAEMYSSYALKKNFSVVKISESLSDLGGYKEAVFEFRGKDVYRLLQLETGVHRIQRVPSTEKIGRVHTST